MSEEPVSQGMEDTQSIGDAPASAEPVPQIIHGVFVFPNPDKSRHFIRFIDSQYNDFFKVPDGGNIIATTRQGWERTLQCRYIVTVQRVKKPHKYRRASVRVGQA